jgi:hypothetical protein
VPEEHQADIKRKLQNAYAMANYEDAERALERLHRELMHQQLDLEEPPDLVSEVEPPDLVWDYDRFPHDSPPL